MVEELRVESNKTKDDLETSQRELQQYKQEAIEMLGTNPRPPTFPELSKVHSLLLEFKNKQQSLDTQVDELKREIMTASKKNEKATEDKQNQTEFSSPQALLEQEKLPPFTQAFAGSTPSMQSFSPQKTQWNMILMALSSFLLN